MLVYQLFKMCEAASFILDVLVGKSRRHDRTCIYVVRRVKIVDGRDIQVTQKLTQKNVRDQNFPSLVLIVEG